MSFGFLPFPLFISLMIISVIGVFILAWKSRSEKLKLVPITFILYGLGGIGGGILKMNQELNFLKSSSLVFWFTMVCSSMSIILTILASYLKTQNNYLKKKLFLQIFFITLGLFFILILLATYFYLKIII